MTREQAIAMLKELQSLSLGDVESAHIHADQVLCDLLTALGYADVVAEYDEILKWYS
jgi:hypothetical protein